MNALNSNVVSRTLSADLMDGLNTGIRHWVTGVSRGYKTEHDLR